jgi:tRNA(Ile)-lysidine synthase
MLAYMLAARSSCPLLERVIQTLERHRMISPGMHVAVAVSGGADSVCLLHVLLELAPRWDLRLSVLHLDHGLRGEESQRDAEFVRALGERLGLPVTIRQAALAAGNLEQEARRARLALFRNSGADRVATGHTRSDQAETVLYRLLRGAGSAGLAAIRPVTRDGIIRPLIDVDRAEVLEYLRARSFPWREDSTNASPRFARNRIRHELLPQLAREWNPAIGETLANMADWAQAEEEWWRAEVNRLTAAHLIERDGAVLVRAELLAELPLAAARRIVRRAIEIVKGDLRGIGFAHLEQALGLTHGRRRLPGIEIHHSLDWIRFSRPGTQGASYSFTPEIPGATHPPGADFMIRMELIEKSETSAAPDYVYNGDMACLDWGRLSGPPLLRNWRPGDRYRPAGADTEQKLKYLFQDARVPSWERRTWPVLTDGGVIVWARRFGAAAQYAADAGSKVVLRIRERQCG